MAPLAAPATRGRSCAETPARRPGEDAGRRPSAGRAARGRREAAAPRGADQPGRCGTCSSQYPRADRVRRGRGEEGRRLPRDDRARKRVRQRARVRHPARRDQRSSGSRSAPGTSACCRCPRSSTSPTSTTPRTSSAARRARSSSSRTASTRTRWSSGSRALGYQKGFGGHFHNDNSDRRAARRSGARDRRPRRAATTRSGCCAPRSRSRKVDGRVVRVPRADRALHDEGPARADDEQPGVPVSGARERRCRSGRGTGLRRGGPATSRSSRSRTASRCRSAPRASSTEGARSAARVVRSALAAAAGTRSDLRRGAGVRAGCSSWTSAGGRAG